MIVSLGHMKNNKYSINYFLCIYILAQTQIPVKREITIDKCYIFYEDKLLNCSILPGCLCRNNVLKVTYHVWILEK